MKCIILVKREGPHLFYYTWLNAGGRIHVVSTHDQLVDQVGDHVDQALHSSHCVYIHDPQLMKLKNSKILKHSTYHAYICFKVSHHYIHHVR